MDIEKLEEFLVEASTKTWAGDGPEAESQRAGFKELEFKNGLWFYRDSYTGFFRSWGQEVVYYDGKPVWTCLYGGGMTQNYVGNLPLAQETFAFLKKALSTKTRNFQPRGPGVFAQEPNWYYFCRTSGFVIKFEGEEEIELHREGITDTVFTHRFFGGLIEGKEVNKYF